MNIKLSAAQQKAVDHLGQNVLVFASAGAGKTKTLIDRLCKRIIIDRIPLNQIVAITFTKAAAAEMRYRLQTELEKKANENKDDTFINEQLLKINDANILTIDSFCLNICKKYYYMVGLDNESCDNILDNSLNKIYLRKAIEDIIFVEDISHIIDNFSNSQTSIDSIIEIFANIIQKAEIQADPVKWMSEVRHHEAANFNEIRNEYTNFLTQFLLEKITTARNALIKMLDLLDSESKLYDEYDKLYQQIDYASTAKNYHELYFRLTNIEAINTRLRGDKEDKETFDRYKKILDKELNKVGEYLFSEDDHLVNYNAFVNLENDILDISLKIYNHYQELKIKNKALVFSDIAHYAYAILTANNNQIANELKEYYQEVMVDEFQDTNPYQYDIISLISNNNLFIVGDIKQSIYRFRGAVPQNMADLKNDPTFAEPIYLDANYRSKKNIVEFNNDFYEKMFKIHDLSFDATDIQKSMAPGNVEDKLDIRIRRFIKDDENDDELDTPEEDFTNREIRDLMIVSEINLITERREKENKKEKFKDIAVLVRTNDEKKSIIKAFEKYNIPYLVTDREGYFKSRVFENILAYLRLLSENNQTNQALVLISLYYEFDVNQLYELKDDYFEYEKFKEDFYELQILCTENDYHALIYKLIYLNDFYYKLSDFERTNINAFLQKLENYSFSSFHEMYHYIVDAKDAHDEVATSANSEADVVKIMTIHNSKGLQFDSVILPVSSSKQKPNSDSLVLNNKYGIGFDIAINEYYKTRSLSKLFMAKMDDQETIAEYCRLFYVATTRAERSLSILYVNASDSANDKEELKNNMYHFGSYLDCLYEGDIIRDSASNMKNGIETTLANPYPPTKTIFIAPPTIKREPIVTTGFNYSPSMAENYENVFDPESIEGMSYGTEIHKTFAKINYTEEINEDSIKKINDSLSASQIEMYLNFVNSDLIKDIRDNKYQIQQELSYYEKTDSGIIHGFIDFMAIKDNDIILIDYKTDNYNDEEKFVNKYLPQQEMYLKTIKERYPGAHITCFLYSCHYQKFIKLF